MTSRRWSRSSHSPGETSAVELHEHYLARSEEVGAEVGAFVRLTPELALEMASAADARVSAGDRTTPPLLGVVCPVRDLDMVAGVPTTFGSGPVEPTFPMDSNVVAAMRAAGLVFTGKTNTPEFGFPLLHRTGRQPPAHTVGPVPPAAGSSGCCRGSLIRIGPDRPGQRRGRLHSAPRHRCVAWWASRPLVAGSATAHSGNRSVTAVYGPLARNVRDAAALLDVMAVPFPDDSRPTPREPEGFLAAADRDPGRLWIGFTDPVVGIRRLRPTYWRQWPTRCPCFPISATKLSLPNHPSPLKSWSSSNSYGLQSRERHRYLLNSESEMRLLTRMLRQRARQATAGNCVGCGAMNWLRARSQGLGGFRRRALSDGSR